MTNSYPPLQLGVVRELKTAVEAARTEEGWLDSPDCPYGADLKKMLRDISAPVIKEVVVEKIVEKRERGRPRKGGKLTDEQASEIEAGAANLLQELDDLKVDGELTTQEKLAIIKTRTQLIEKLVNIRERFTNAKEVGKFQATVLRILDDLVTEDGRAEFIKRTSDYASV